MSVEIGHFALALALALSIVQSIVPVVGAHRRDTQLMSVAAPMWQFCSLRVDLPCIGGACPCLCRVGFLGPERG